MSKIRELVWRDSEIKVSENHPKYYWADTYFGVFTMLEFLNKPVQLSYAQHGSEYEEDLGDKGFPTIEEAKEYAQAYWEVMAELAIKGIYGE